MNKANQILKKIGGIVHEYVMGEDNRKIGIIVSAVIILIVILAIV